jgi:hypothetical protein
MTSGNSPNCVGLDANLEDNVREYANLPGRTATASPSTPHISETEPKTVVHQRLQIQDAIRSILSAALLAVGGVSPN